MEKIENKFNPKDFEEKIYQNWEEKGYFKPSMNKNSKSYSIMMPPPNVTGKLHMGHALDCTIQDILIRTKRMQGYNTLWLPGSDHASIATEVKVVEKMKKEENLTKKDITREQFLERAWAWTKEYGGTIKKQQRKLGASCDWSRDRFTMDEGLSKAVLEQFVKLYEKGLIYKGKRMINWCPSCHTTISDAEVEYKDEASHLWHLRYKIVKNENEKDIPDYVEVATTRPETMLGDTAVAVNPLDKRYKKLVGRKVIVPIVNREIPIIADDFVDTEFGTGCVKVTPAHDFNDYQAGIKHNLEIIEVFDDSSIMNNLVPEYKGMKAIDARDKIVEKLKEIGALVSIEDYEHNVGKCYRCHTTIEPRISEQWFVKMKDLAKRAADAVRNDEVKFVPKRYEKMYFNWLDNIQDWCISRQLWWGHRIPVYYCDDCKHINVSREKVTKCEKCGSTHLHQDEDTLDTWFSSALWPFSTLGWPDTESEDYKTFFPTNVLVTGFDIITFWVSRMMTQSLELTNKVPFKDVLIHGIVRDSQGRKMSKSLGNGIDPIEIINKYGADSLRFSLLSGTTMGNDIKYMPEKLEQASNFANKIWNASKFVLSYSDKAEEIDKEQLTPEEKWIISKLNNLIKEITLNIDHYDLGVAIDKLYSFIWNEFCDWYIEMCKVRLNSENKEERRNAIAVLQYVLKTLMKLLHPFMPFITTEIYNHLKNENDKELMIADWPKEISLTQSNEKCEECLENYAKSDVDLKKAEELIEELKNIIVKVRNIRTTMNVHPSKKVKLIFVTEKYSNELQMTKEMIKKLAFGNEIVIQENEANIAKDAVSVSEENIKLFMPFDELVDIEEEKKRLHGEKERLEKEVERSTKMLTNQGFISKAPEAKVKEEKEKKEKYEMMLKDVTKRLESM